MAPPAFSRARTATVGCLLASLALVVIWAARLTVDRPVYVSALGADGEPTSGWFAFALFLLVVGALAIAWSGRGVRSAAPVLRLWTPSVSIAIAAGFFYLASRVPCTSGCPLPVGETFVLQDFVHTVAAVVAFAAACVAMLQASFTRGCRSLRVLSLVAALSVAVIAATGGILSLMRSATDIGGMLELVATTIAISWLVAFGALARRVHALEEPDGADTPGAGLVAPSVARTRRRRRQPLVR